MITSPPSPHDHDDHDDIGVLEDVLNHERSINEGDPRSPLLTLLHAPVLPEPLSDYESTTDDMSERSVLAQHHRYARIFPPSVLHSSQVQPMESTSKISFASQTFEAAFPYSDVQPNSNQHGETTFSVQDRASSLSPTESAVNDGDALEKLWFRVADKKAETSDLRYRLSKLRRQTKKARLEKDAVDNTFMSTLRPLLVNPSTAIEQGSGVADRASAGLSLNLDVSRLQELLKTMQGTRHRCQECEVSLEVLEDELETALEELDHLERQLINKLRPGAQQIGENNIIQGEIPEEYHDEYRDDLMPEPLLGLNREPMENYHPLYMRFMLTIGERSLAEEEYSVNFSRKTEIEDDLHRLELRKQYQQEDVAITRQPDTVDLEFLREFDKEQGNTLEHIAQLRYDVDYLRELCFEKGVVPRYAALGEIYYYYPLHFSVELDSESESNKGFDTNAVPYTTTARFWILLSNPSHLFKNQPVTAETSLKEADAALEKDPDNSQLKEIRKAALKEFFLEHPLRDLMPGDKGTFVNRWALHKLRISPGEVELLYSSFTDETGLVIRDFCRWQNDVLYCWQRDEAAQAPPEQYKGAISKVKASSEGSISSSSLISSSAESFLISNQSTLDRALDGCSHAQADDWPDGRSQDAMDPQDTEVSTSGFSRETLKLPGKQSSVQSVFTPPSVSTEQPILSCGEAQGPSQEPQEPG